MIQKSKPPKPKKHQNPNPPINLTVVASRVKPALVVMADGMTFEPMAVTGPVAAALLSVSDKTLYSMRERGQIRAVRVDPKSDSAQLRYPMSEIKRFLAGDE